MTTFFQQVKHPNLKSQELSFARIPGKKSSVKGLVL